MFILNRESWADTSLDYHRAPDAYRVRVLAMANIERLTGLYFVRPLSPRMLWNYVIEVGLLGVWRKVTSRLQERFRNEKYASVGIGEILEAPADARFAVGRLVSFVASSTPACLERVVLPEALLRCAAPSPALELESTAVLHLRASPNRQPQSSWWRRVRGWDANSGLEFSPRDEEAITSGLEGLIRTIDWTVAMAYPLACPSAVRETRQQPAARKGRTARLSGVLFGYGHYAKTNVLPNVRPWISVDTSHEVDPTQIPPTHKDILAWDTSPEPHSEAAHDVYLIAGYHHTHAPLAITALDRGAYVVVEKPLAVDHDQLDSLLTSISASAAGYFGCFHKRFSPLNDAALHDLRQKPGNPIDYHCIVYEVPLPELHWYRWPNSKSRLISNGCHWIDHFLYLNGFCEVEAANLDVSPSEVINCSLTLRNGAYFSMLLTDRGSERIGLQEHVELRAGEVTITITNNGRYLAEDRVRRIRRLNINRTLPYRLMYRTIASRIAAGEGGDTLQSVRVSTSAVLRLEEMLTSK